MVLRSYNQSLAAKVALAAFLLALRVTAADAPGLHDAAEDSTGPLAVTGQNTPTREQLLINGLKNAHLNPRALSLLENAFKDTPRVGVNDFINTVTQIGGQNRDLFKPDQVERLKKLFNETLAGVNGEPGKELTQALRKVLKESGPKGEAVASEGLKKEAPAAAAEPDLAAQLTAQLDKALTPQEKDALGSGSGLLSQLSNLGLLKQLLGGDKEDHPDPRPTAPAVPAPPTHSSSRARENRGQEKDSKGSDRGLLDALARGRGGGGFFPPQQPAAAADDKKTVADEKKPAAPDYTPSNKRTSSSAADATDTADAKTDPSADSASSILDSLKNAGGGASEASPNGRPLGPIANGGGAAGPGGMGPGGPFGRPGMAGAMGGIANGMMGGMGGMMGGGMAGMGGMGGMMGAMGAGMGSSGGSGFSGDVFNVGGGGLPAGGGIAGGSGFNIVRDGGYGGVGGGAAGGGPSGEEEAVAVAEADFPTPTGNPPRIATFSEQIDMSPAAIAPGMSLPEKMAGYVGKGLCASEENRKSVGFCEGLALRKSKEDFSRRIGRQLGRI